MDPYVRRKINELADYVREQLGLGIPVDVMEAVQKLGGDFEYRDDLEQGRFDAVIQKDGDSFLIGLPFNPQYEPRHRFSIAHELGHLFIHMGYMIDLQKWEGIDEYRDSVMYRYGYSQEEFEANEFAAAFLMPAQEFEDVLRENYDDGFFDLEDIANYFKVSLEAARNRGRWLGFFEWD